MPWSRRKLLLAGGGVICARAIGCGGSDQIVLPAEIPAGNSSAVTLNTLTPVAAAAAAIGRDSGGIYALTLVCTHQACDIAHSGGGSVSFSRIHCGCHGSEFNGQGLVLLGPATRNLDHLLVTADASGALTIHGDQVVAANIRLNV
jgi:Rieske Fe-S protein